MSKPKAPRHKNWAARTPEAPTPYYSDWRTRPWICACGWTGKGKDLARRYTVLALDLLCEKCGAKLAFIVYPKDKDVQAAAAEGNLEAIAELRNRAGGLAAARKALEQLPDLSGERLTFTMETVADNDWLNPEWLVLLNEGREIYREPSGFEAWRAILDIGAALKAHYGDRIAWLDPGEAGVVLLGDNLRAPGEITRFLSEQHLTPPAGKWGPSFFSPFTPD